MTTSYMFFTLEPTKDQIDVYITKTETIEYEYPQDLSHQLAEIEAAMRESTGNPAFYQFKASEEYPSDAECDAAQTQKQQQFDDEGLTVHIL